jgi:D-alanyl-D-alanine carboxypeptidase
MARRKTKVLFAGGMAAAVLVGAGSTAALAASRHGHGHGHGHGSGHGYGQAALQRDADAIRAVGVTGVQVRVTTAKGRPLVATSGVSVVGTDRPVPPNSYFRIGSTNKALVATVVLQLAGERRLGLDDSVGHWLPGAIRGNGNDGDRITVRQLLQHTSGIYDGSYPSIDSADEYYKHRYDVHTPQEIVAAATRHAPDFPPGERWSYANTGYVLLGMLIERVTGHAWEQEVAHRILRPLGMRHTVWPGTSPRMPAPYARGYTRFGPGEPLVDTTELTDADASGGYLSTTADLERFLRALFGGRLLHRTQFEQMRQTVPVDEEINKVWPGARYGLGIISRPLPCGGIAWIPSGDQLGYRTRTGVLAGGHRSVVISMSTQLFDSWDSAVAQDNAAGALIDHVLCDAT